MKELSVEEKAQRYDEALERARYWEKNPTVWSSDDICQKLFPELKESSDERIRKSLLYVIEHHPTLSTEEAEEYIAWLEKQGEQKPVISDDALREGITLFGITQFQIDNWLKKYVDVEKQQKSADKVESKFHKGDWVVFNNKHQSIYQVEKIEDGYYILRHTHGGTFRVCVLHDESLRLWTIQDSKNGDVLAVEPGNDYPSPFIAIYKERGLDYFNSYCFIGSDGKFYTGDTGHDIIGIHPATKEQRDTLMKAMTDAGYTFDFEKKELKKIVVPKFNVHDCVIKKHNSNINDFGSFVITDISGGKYWYNDRIICDIAEQDEWEIYEPVRQKPAWSEEDTQYINDTLALLSFGCSTHSVGEVKEWLQSLNNRVQPKQEWSEEDINMIDWLIRCCEKEHEELCSDKYGHQDIVSDLKRDCRKKWDWLESLKNRVASQKQWKPSDEQLNSLYDVLNPCDGFNRDVLESLYNDLKKL